MEYKLKLIHPSATRLQQLVTQLKYRLAEGRGRATYMLGVEDDGFLRGLATSEMDASISTLRRMCAQTSASISAVRRHTVSQAGAVVAEVSVDLLAECAQSELRLAMLGGTQVRKCQHIESHVSSFQYHMFSRTSRKRSGHLSGAQKKKKRWGRHGQASIFDIDRCEHSFNSIHSFVTCLDADRHIDAWAFDLVHSFCLYTIKVPTPV